MRERSEDERYVTDRDRCGARRKTKLGERGRGRAYGE